MSTTGRIEPGAGELVLADALAVAVGTVGAFVFRASVRSYDSLAPDHLASLILPALPFALGACLVALWSSGLYGPRRPDSMGVDVAAALAWAASALAFLAFYWAKGPDAPFLVMAVGYVLTLGSVLALRSYLANRPASRRST